MIYRLCLAANFRTFEPPVYMLSRLCDNAALRGSGRRHLALFSASFCNGDWILRLKCILGVIQRKQSQKRLLPRTLKHLWFSGGASHSFDDP